MLQTGLDFSGDADGPSDKTMNHQKRGGQTVDDTFEKKNVSRAIEERNGLAINFV